MSKQEIFEDHQDRKYSTYFFDRYLAEECSASEKFAFDAELMCNHELRIRFEAFKIEDQHFENLVPEMQLLLDKKAKSSEYILFGLFKKWWLQGGVVTTLCAFVLFFLISEKPKNVVRLKGRGEHFMQFYVRHADSDEIIKGEENIQLYPEDQVQFVVYSQEEAYVVIYARDALDVISRYAPQKEAMVKIKGEHRFQSSITLDDNLGREDFLAVKCERDYPLSELKENLEKNWQNLPEDCLGERILVQKVSK